MHQYFHNIEKKIVYRWSALSVDAMPSRGRKPAGWTVSAHIEITNANNRIVGNSWLYPTFETPNTQFHSPQYSSRNDVIILFESRNKPKGQSISKDEYEQLREKYETIANQSDKI